VSPLANLMVLKALGRLVVSSLSVLVRGLYLYSRIYFPCWVARFGWIQACWLDIRHLASEPNFDSRWVSVYLLLLLASFWVHPSPLHSRISCINH